MIITVFNNKSFLYMKRIFFIQRDQTQSDVKVRSTATIFFKRTEQAKQTTKWWLQHRFFSLVNCFLLPSLSLMVEDLTLSSFVTYLTGPLSQTCLEGHFASPCMFSQVPTNLGPPHLGQDDVRQRWTLFVRLVSGDKFPYLVPNSHYPWRCFVDIHPRPPKHQASVETNRGKVRCCFTGKEQTLTFVWGGRVLTSVLRLGPGVDNSSAGERLWWWWWRWRWWRNS